MGQSASCGILRSFFLQPAEVGQFCGFSTVFLYFFLSKPEIPHFDPLACTIGDLYIKNSHAMFTYNIPGTSSSIFIGFCGIEF